MSNRIIISESQYSRLFLNEQFNSFTNPLTAQHPTFNKDATTGALNSDQIIKGFGLPDIEVNLCLVEDENYVRRNSVRSIAPVKFKDENPVDWDKIQKWKGKYTKVATKWKELRKWNNWYNSEVINVNYEWLEKNNNSLELLFNPKKSKETGVINVNLINPCGLFKDYVKFWRIMSNDIGVKIHRQIFLNNEDKEYKNIEKEKLLYRKELESWKNKWGEKSGNIIKREEKKFNKKLYKDMMPKTNSTYVDIPKISYEMDYIHDKEKDYTKMSKPKEVEDTTVPNFTNDTYFLTFDYSNGEYLKKVGGWEVSGGGRKQKLRNGERYWNGDELLAIQMEMYKVEYVNKVKAFQDWLDISHPKWVNGKNLNKGDGYGNLGPKTKKQWSLYSWDYLYDKEKWVPNAPKEPQYHKKTLSDRGFGDKHPLEQSMDYITEIIRVITDYNSKKFGNQSISKTNEFCYNNKHGSAFIFNNWEKVKGNYNKLGRMSHIAAYQSTPYKEISWSEWCSNDPNIKDKQTDFYKNNSYQEKNASYRPPADLTTPNGGGVYVYDGNESYTKGCGCVSMSEVKRSYNFGEISPSDDMMKMMSGVDTRGGWEKFSSWASECWGDWHCVADIASIAALFIPVPGLNLAISAGIDLVSGIGYIIEDEEGAAVLATLTLIGAVGGFGEMISIGAKAAKYTKIMSGVQDLIIETNKLEKSVGFLKLSKLEQTKKWDSVIADILKRSTTSELKFIEQVLNVSKGVGKSDIANFTKMADSMSSLNKVQKAELRKVLKGIQKGNNYDKFIKELTSNGYDIKKTLKNRVKKLNIRQATLQSLLFTTMNVYPDETANAIFGGLTMFKKLTGIDLSQYLSNIKGLESIDVKELLEAFIDYDEMSKDIIDSIDKSSNELKNKYGVDFNEIKTLLFNPDDPLIGDYLKGVKTRLDSILGGIDDKIKYGYTVKQISDSLEKDKKALILYIGEEKHFENALDKLAEKYGNRDNPIDGIDKEEFMQIKRDAELFK